MTSTPRARRAATSGEARAHFAWVSHVSYTDQPRAISVMNGRFFKAHYAEVHFESTRFGAPEHPRASVTKNVYNLTPAFVLDGGLVVNEATYAELQRLCKIEYREVKIERAFWYPYEPGSDRAEYAGVDEETMFTEDLMLEFAAKYPCRAPSEVFYELLAPSTDKLQSRYPDGLTLLVGAGAGEGSSVCPNKTYISQKMIEEFGMVYVGGYAMRPDVFDVLNPYLHRPWFWTQRYLYEAEEALPKPE